MNNNNSYSCQLDQTVENFKRTMKDSKKAEQITVKWQDMARTSRIEQTQSQMAKGRTR